MTTQQQFNSSNIKHDEKISQLLALELTEFFFDLFIDHNIHIDRVFRDFKSHLNQTILHGLSEGKTTVANLANYYALIIKDKNKPFNPSDDFSGLKIIANNENENTSFTDIEQVLDIYFYNPANYQKIIKASRGNFDVFIMPLSTLSN